MKITRIEVLFGNGAAKHSPELKLALTEIEQAVTKVVWPLNTMEFSLNPTRKGNGVKPIKNACMDHLKRKGWSLEERLQITLEQRPGPIDAVKQCGSGKIALEWETGNISSSHRAINKMMLGMLERKIIAGILVLPSRNMYSYLTDRVGNFQELQPYFSVYKNFNIQDGYLAIVEIEHDTLDEKAPLIPKGTDGRAKI